MFRTLTYSILVLGLVTSSGIAQTSGEQAVSAGQRVRIRTHEDGREWQEGTVTALETDTLRMHLGGPEVAAIPLAGIEDIQVSTGRRSNFSRGLLFGLLGGAALGVAIGFAEGDDPEGFISISAESKAGLGAAFFGIVGAMIGSIVGAATSSERWETVSLDAVELALTPSYDGGVSVALNYSF